MTVEDLIGVLKTYDKNADVEISIWLTADALDPSNTTIGWSESFPLKMNMIKEDEGSIILNASGFNE